MGIFDKNSKPSPEATAKEAQKDYSPAFYSLIEVVDRIAAKVAEMREAQLKAPETKQEVITLGVQPYAFDDKGYKYFGLFAAANGTINVEALGIRYGQAIVAGFNKIVLPPNAALTMVATTSLLAVWSDHLEI